MLKFQSMPLRRQMVLLVVVMTIVPLGIIAYSVFSQLNSDLREARLIVERLANEVANDQKALISSSEQLLSTLAYIPAVQQRDVKTVNALFAELIKSTPQITNILMIDRTGLVWASALPMRSTIMANDRRFFKSAMATGRFSSGEYTVGRVLSKPAFSFGYPLKDRFGTIRDIATVSFTLTKYHELLRITPLTKNTSLLLTDHKGTILFSAPASDLIGKQDRPDLAGRMANGPDEGSFEAVGNTGVSRIYYYKKLRLAGETAPYMYVRAGLAKKPLLGKTNAALLINTGVMLAVLLLSLGVTVYISKHGILDKVNALRDATQRVARGDFEVRVSEHVTGGELGELGQSFDEMAKALVRDNIERKRAEDEIRRLNNELEQRVQTRTAQLEEANREQEAFSYSVSHDLRAPLRHINSFSAMLQEEFGGMLPEKALSYLVRIEKASSRMGELIDDLLQLSRVSRAEMRLVPVNLSDKARQVAEMLQSISPGRAVEYVIADGVVAQGDPTLLQLVMENLLGNAWKYSELKPSARIEFGRETVGGEVAYFVRDNGVGFDMTYADKLFHPFQRLHGQEFEGTGIGLATVRRIVERHNGRIWAEGKDGEGATFYFRLGDSPEDGGIHPVDA